MSIFGRFERKVEGAVNGVFARAFKGDVQPVEIAARLQRELDTEAKLMSRDKRLVPNEFVVGLSEHDYDKLTPYSKTLIAELAGELHKHARDMGYVFNGPIRIHFERNPTADRSAHRGLRGGRRLLDAAGPPGQPRTAGPPWCWRSTASGTRCSRRDSLSDGAPTPTCGSTIPASLGCTRRSRSARAVTTCRPRSSTSGSTNGILVNGQRVPRAALPRAPGSRSARPGCWCTRPPGAERPMSEIAVTVIKVLYLALLWLFILSAVSVIRSDLFGRTVPAPGPQPAQPLEQPPPPPKKSGARGASRDRSPSRRDPRPGSPPISPPA